MLWYISFLKITPFESGILRETVNVVFYQKNYNFLGL
jgi:hypothetical protein